MPFWAFWDTKGAAEKKSAPAPPTFKGTGGGGAGGGAALPAQAQKSLAAARYELEGVMGMFRR
jgi:hypothetical protein